MDELDSVLTAYQIGHPFGLTLVPASPRRDWMDQTTKRFARRCLPMQIASEAGWVILNDRLVRAKWLGGVGPDSVIVECEGPSPYPAASHFGHGILTFRLPYLFRSSRGIEVLIRGPANSPKDAISPLEGLVESDWSVSGVAMHWKFTRIDTWIQFAAGEPICMIVPYQLRLLEATRTRLAEIQDDKVLHQHHLRWWKAFHDFNERLRRWEARPRLRRAGSSSTSGVLCQVLIRSGWRALTSIGPGLL